MATPPSYDPVKCNFSHVLEDPSKPLDIPAIERLTRQITESMDKLLLRSLTNQIAQLLPILQEDPSPLTTLGVKATAFLTFSEIYSIHPSINFIAGLKAPSPPINLLALSLLRKAGGTPGDAVIVASNSELVISLIELWLSTSATEVAQTAFDVLWSLLEVDHVGSVQAIDRDGTRDLVTGQGLVWRKIFADKDVYCLFYLMCSLTGHSQPKDLSKRERTVAQGRLLDFIVKAGTLRWDTIATSHFPDIESTYRCNSLLHFAACRMVDTGDVLMHMTLLNFFRELLTVDSPGLMPRKPSQLATPSSPALDFLLNQGLHEKVLSYYLDPLKLDSVDKSYLSSPVMAYVAQYVQLYPNHLLQNPEQLLDSILSRILQSLSIPSTQWAHGPVPTGDLTILSSLPRVMLVEASRRSLNPLLSLPTNPTNEDVLYTLASIFHGPAESREVPATGLNAAGRTLTNPHKEAAAARVLYFEYLNHHANFWDHIVAAADILAMKDVALAAIALMRAVTTAHWQPLSSGEAEHISTQARFQLPSEHLLGRLSPSTQGILPASGVWALLTPPAMTTVLPYLFKPPKTHANSVGGGAGDPESAIWIIASAKYDALVALYCTLRGTPAQTEEFTDILRSLETRVKQGPWGRVSQIGSRVDALGI